MNSTTTTASIQALTTPFVPPPNCADHFITTSFRSSYPWNNYSSTTVNVLVSGQADSRFPACQPTGWDQGEGFQFSPAVCPSQWTVYELGLRQSVISTPTARVKTLTTAYCCSSGFSFSFINNFPIKGIPSTACFQDIAGEVTTSTSTSASTSASTSSKVHALPETTQPFPRGLRVHKAWHISWESTDVPTLSPTPPELLCTTAVLDSWVPGETVDPSRLGAGDVCNDGTSHASASETSLFLFMVIGVPIIILAILISCCVTCCHQHRKKKRAKAQESTPATHKIPNPAKAGGG